MDFEKTTNSFERKKNTSPDYLSGNNLFHRFVNSFSKLLLLCKINVIGVFNEVVFLKIFVTSRCTAIIVESNFWLKMYVPYILMGAFHLVGSNVFPDITLTQSKMDFRECNRRILQVWKKTIYRPSRRFFISLFFFCFWSSTWK